MNDSELTGRIRQALAERYAVERELGQGGTAIVYLAQDLRHSRPVAIKVLRPELAAFVGAERFLREIETLARLQHPHILPLYDSGEAAGLLYFVMPYVAGDTLRDRLDREHHFPLDDALAIARDVAAALSYAHSQEVVHRDIKPDNILMFSGAAVVADFGIARALRVAGGGHMTEAGLALGTPLYMSPEQAAASGNIDARSDIYSLGCVIYEMLVGSPPFTGLSAGDVMAHHLHDRPQPITDLRSTVPPALALAIAKALQKAPADRFASMAEFAEALRVPSGERTPIPLPIPRKVRRTALALLALLAVGLVAAGRYAWALRRVDPGLFVVLPFLDSGLTHGSLDGQSVAHLTSQALARWSDVRLVDELRAHDAWVGLGAAAPRLTDVLLTARTLGAGRAIWGQLRPHGDSVEVQVSLFASATGRALASESAVLPDSGGFGLVRPAFERMTAGLLSGKGEPNAQQEWVGTQSVVAWQAYAEGRALMLGGQLPAALRALRRATAEDPAFPQASLAAAQVAHWLGLPSTEWRAAAAATLANGAKLAGSRDTLLARGMVALADGDNAAACDAYDRILKRDSLDAAAWYGRGDCQRLDRYVIRDARSPSLWRFRGSLHGALTAYRRALALAPTLNYAFGSQVYSRAASALFIAPQQFRSGVALPPAQGTFAAFSSLQGDTIAFIPYPDDEVRSGRHLPPTHAEAVALSRNWLRAIVGDWVQAHPSSADAHMARARILEADGDLMPVSGGDSTSAFDELRRAAALADDPSTRLRIGRARVRVLLKAGGADAARALADSLLNATPAPLGFDGQVLACLAALLGRVRTAGDLLAMARTDALVLEPRSGRMVPVPTPAANAASGFYLLAFAGAGRALLDSAERSARGEARRWVAVSDRSFAFAGLLNNGLRAAFFETGSLPLGAGDGSDYIADLEALVARRDTAALRLRLAEIRTSRQSLRPGDQDPASVWLEARLYLVLHDSVSAYEHLRSVLTDLPAGRLTILDDPGLSLGLVRAMALAATLAAARGDMAEARRWAATVAKLWASSDAPLQPLVDSMRTIAGSR